MLKKNLTTFSLWKNEKSNADELKNKLSSMGIDLDTTTGHLFYTPQFKPFSSNFELVFVRHGETYGNCGQSTSNGEIDHELVKSKIKSSDKRIYQGDVDDEINKLTENGKQQAIDAADKLNNDFLEKGWKPDIILISPLTRAKDTAVPFVQKNKFEDICVIYEEIKEMSFGAWDNRRVCDIQSDDPCHLFYREQHALVKDVTQQSAENFCDVLLRAHAVLSELNKSHANKRILMFSHSMFGAACCILLGRGQKIENGEQLAFDGKRKDGSYYTIPNATPLELTPNTVYNQNVLRKL